MATHNPHPLNYKPPRKKTNIFFVFVLILLLATSVSPLIGSALVQTLPVTVTFTAEADSRVNQSNPYTNYGNSSYIQVDGAGDPDVEGLIRFTVAGIVGNIQDAKLRVYVSTNGSTNGPAVYGTGTSWTETNVTWNNRPSRLTGVLDDQGNVNINTWVEYDVTTWVTGNGTFSFVLATNSNDATTFSSREGSHPPQLIIAAEGVSSPTSVKTTMLSSVPLSMTPANTQVSGSAFTFISDADAQVKEASPNSNYGHFSTLQADGAGDPDVEGLIRFTVAGSVGNIQNVKLRVYVSTNGSTNGPAIYATDTSWVEADVTWDTRPARITGVLDDRDNLNINTWAEYDVTTWVTGNGTFSFVLAADTSDATTFSSREGSYAPQLVVTTDSIPTQTPTANPTPVDPVVLVGAGDIATCSHDDDELTARLLDKIPGTVFTAGDNAYVDGTYTEYIDCYDPTWGRHKSRTKPVPGNHEYETADAAGYFQYFDNIDPYYAYDLGTWRIYALNSEIDVSDSSLQMAWLQADLAAHPKLCVLAYWHRPRWSSGASHGGDPAMQALWQVFYEAGAELVINGHEHHYERFTQMDAAGSPVAQGLREIVAGMGGGAGHYPFGTILSTSEMRDNTSFGVLKLSLGVGSYQWQFIPVEGALFTDSGTSTCH